jgi:phosphatidylserine decarboxylase
MLVILFVYLEILWLVACFLLVSGFVAFFFRDPEREIPADPNAIVSPADGKIILLEQDERGTALSIFLSVFDVHVNRAPIDGLILSQEYRPGRFRVAYDSRASIENEQVVLTIGERRTITLSLIAGILARRIRLWKKKGDQVRRGDRIGLIRFGSRVDVFLPPDCQPFVGRGERVYGGTSIIAFWRQGS